MGLDVRGDDAAWAAVDSIGTYRYALGRSWHGSIFSPRVVCFVLHNPSTADHANDDPTLRRCEAFAKREGYDQIVLVNRFAYRATDKAILLDAHDAVGGLNSEVVPIAFSAADTVVFAWGKVDHRIDYIPSWQFGFLPRMCLGKNVDGSPKHPLYLAKNTPLVRFT